MRQGQQNRRGRGRGGRKVQNPLSRNFESNGPSVKIRGTAAHVAEKYMTLARDALASGDNVMAENFLQHAEHYNRIIMSAQTQFGGNSQPGTDGANGSGGHRPGQGQGDGNRQNDESGAQGDHNGGMAHMGDGDQPDVPQGSNGSGQHHDDDESSTEDAQGGAAG